MKNKNRKSDPVEISKLTAFQAHLFISISSPVPSRRDCKHSSSDSQMTQFTALIIAKALRKKPFAHKTQALILYHLHQKSVVMIGSFTNEILPLQPLISGSTTSEMLVQRY